MCSSIQTFFSTLFGSNSFLATLVIALVPIVELKGAIPFGMSTELWHENALSGWAAFGASVLGLSILAMVLAGVYKPLVDFLKKTKMFKKLGEKIDLHIEKKKQEINKKIDLQTGQSAEQDFQSFNQNNNQDYSQNGEKHQVFNAEELSANNAVLNQDHSKNVAKKVKFAKVFSVFLFVALPLPLTGVWTGTCVAVALNLNYFETCLTVILANVVAGLVVVGISSFFGASTHILIYIFFAILLVLVFVILAKNLIASKTK